MSESTRDYIARQLGIAPAVVDRLAAAWGLAMGRTAKAEDGPHPEVDAFPDGAVLRELLRARGVQEVEAELAAATAAGRAMLAGLVDSHGERPRELLLALLDVIAVSGRATGDTVDVPVGEIGGRVVRWAFDQEAGKQTNANTRITGQPGMGKSQFLKHLLAAVATRSPEVGFVLLDYKGDLSNHEFVEATNATVLRPEREAVPFNPFDVPSALDRRLVAAAIAETLGSLDPHIGNVQKSLLRRGVSGAYDRHSSPSTVDIARAVQQTYAEESRAADSVTGLLEQLAELGLFATRSELTVAAFLSRRWIVDLSGLQTLRDLVAYVVLSWMARHIQSLVDAPLRGGTRRRLRCVLAIDEAHHYIQRRCGPVLELLRVGRSKGVPIVLSSQSLTDFKRFTELEEFLPNNFVLGHGIAPELRDLQGALRLPRDGARAAAERSVLLDQFQALTSLPDAQDEIRLYGFHERRFRD